MGASRSRRHENFNEYRSKKVVDNVDLMVKSANVREAALDHILFVRLRSWKNFVGDACFSRSRK